MDIKEIKEKIKIPAILNEEVLQNRLSAVAIEDSIADDLVPLITSLLNHRSLERSALLRLAFLETEKKV
mgnify:CR=1 FL=1